MVEFRPVLHWGAGARAHLLLSSPPAVASSSSSSSSARSPDIGARADRTAEGAADGTEAAYSLACRLQEEGNLAGAAAVYSAVLKKDPFHEDARLGLALVRDCLLEAPSPMSFLSAPSTASGASSAVHAPRSLVRSTGSLNSVGRGLCSFAGGTKQGSLAFPADAADAPLRAGAFAWKRRQGVRREDGEACEDVLEVGAESKGSAADGGMQDAMRLCTSSLSGCSCVPAEPASARRQRTAAVAAGVAAQGWHEVAWPCSEACRRRARWMAARRQAVRRQTARRPGRLGGGAGSSEARAGRDI